MQLFGGVNDGVSSCEVFAGAEAPGDGDDGDAGGKGGGNVDAGVSDYHGL